MVASSRVSESTFALAASAVLTEVFKGNGQGEKFTEGIPAQVILFLKLLHVLRCGTAGAGFEEAAAVHQGNDREHLSARADFEDREEVGEIVAQDIAGDGDRVLACLHAFESVERGIGWRFDRDVETGRCRDRLDSRSPW